jgi:hypothetical protein
VIDASSGTVPLPSNLLLDGSTLPDDPFAPATSARVSNQPAAFGPLAPGLATLDGFSTTALTLIPLSGAAVVATGATPTSTFTNNIFLYDLSDPRNPVLVNPATYDELLPSGARQQAAPGVFASSVVGVQPASAAKPGTLPLKEATEYAVIVTKRIRTLPNQTPLARPSVGDIVLFNNPVYANGQSLLAGVPVAQAKILERMRAQIANVLPKLAALPSPQTTTKADIALAFTFRTQTITSPSLQLAAAPYADVARSTQIVPTPLTAPAGGAILAPADAFTKYGIDDARDPERCHHRGARDAGPELQPAQSGDGRFRSGPACARSVATDRIVEDPHRRPDLRHRARYSMPRSAGRVPSRPERGTRPDVARRERPRGEGIRGRGN